MKVIAVIEVPESDKGKWYIDGMIRYTEDESLMKVFDKDLVELKPLPSYKEVKYKWEDEFDVWVNGANYGYNNCLDEIQEKQNEQSI